MRYDDTHTSALQLFRIKGSTKRCSMGQWDDDYELRGVIKREDRGSYLI